VLRNQSLMLRVPMSPANVQWQRWFADPWKLLQTG
jgi:hypothetical protein